ncbi:N-substituted formamide deformylase [subsurface metagenome]
MTKPYNYSRTKGKILITIRKLENIIRKAEDNSIQLMIHSIGDRTTDTISRVFERNIDKENPLRHRLEHIEILNTSSMRKIAKMNLIVSMQPNFVRRWQKPGGMYEQYLGKRYREMNCFKKLLDSGIRVIFGSDCMPLGPLYGIQGALEHPFSCGRLSTCAAFRAYTKDGAYATFDENKKGTIDTNKLADLVVLDKNPLKEKEPDKIKILMVLIAGKIVYRRANVSH